MKEEISVENCITKDFLDRCRAAWESDESGHQAARAITKNGPLLGVMDVDVPRRLPFTFSVDVWDEGVTDQGESLRCWAFASLNVVRQSISENLNLAEKNFELSQNFTYFYDQLEKSAKFLENVCRNFDKPLRSPAMLQMLRRPIMDNGQWFVFAPLAKKYGVVPKFVMPDTQCSPDTKYVTRILSDKLRYAAHALRQAHEQGAGAETIQSIKEQELAGVYGILCRFLGQPPATFDFPYQTKDGQFKTLKNITPLEFFALAQMDVEEYMTIIHHPVPHCPYGKTYTGNQDGTDDMSKMLNLDMDTIKKLVIAQLQGGQQVVMGCDVAKQSHKPSGYMHARLYDYEKAFGTPMMLSKTDRILYKGTSGTHIMAFDGVSLDENQKPLRWKVHNSYGDSMGIHGHYVMDDSWFDGYVLSVVIRKKYAPEEIVRAYQQKPEIMAPGELY